MSRHNEIHKTTGYVKECNQARELRLSQTKLTKPVCWVLQKLVDGSDAVDKSHLILILM